MAATQACRKLGYHSLGSLLQKRRGPERDIAMATWEIRCGREQEGEKDHTYILAGLPGASSSQQRGFGSLLQHAQRETDGRHRFLATDGCGPTISFLRYRVQILFYTYSLYCLNSMTQNIFHTLYVSACYSADIYIHIIQLIFHDYIC